MTLAANQLVVLVAPRAGEEEPSLPVRLCELTGKSRTQVSIELQRGEVELLRTDDASEAAHMVAKAAAVGLLAIVRSTPRAEPALSGPADGWGRVLGAFDAKVAVAPVPSPERRPSAWADAEHWSHPSALRLGELSEPAEESAPASGPRPSAAEERPAPFAPRDLLDASQAYDRPATPSARRQVRAARPAKRPFPLRAGLIVFSLVLLVGIGVATFRRLRQTVVAPPETAVEAIDQRPTAAARDAGPPEVPDHAEQVRLLVDRASDACRKAEFERCKLLADQALDLDETNRAAQAVHIRAVTAISAAAGRPTSAPVTP